jgi:hypothetical protein
MQKVIQKIIADIKDKKITLEEVSDILRESGIANVSNAEFRRLNQHIERRIESKKEKTSAEIEDDILKAEQRANGITL